ncbi:hypothetical protein B9G79_01155 [Bdellovibrio bacteriovorus]|uniref:Anti-bacteriophage protein A/HamA C-terminal domain-containing protein n=1 Tax=Bdellovibrio bacteriovorus TaxID=959 RepID=A0A1Z3N458_BDEBC|nr:hypothetical protein B9G79_01155 [Bdellovibrio bacteriovorus]
MCHGSSRAELDGEFYTYNSTIKEFWERLKEKDPPKKMGMVAEFLTHVLILEIFKDFFPASVFFNLEERSVKKGFDLVFKNKAEIWITEIKSGLKNTTDTSNDRIKELISIAKRDIKEKLKEDRSTLWQNAVNHVDIALVQSDERKAIKSILMQGKTAALAGTAQHQNHNVVLVAGLFANVSDLIQDTTIKMAAQAIRNENIFKKEIVIAFQKNTFETVVNFFESEAQNA